MLQLSEREALLGLNTMSGIGAQKLKNLYLQYHTYAAIWNSIKSRVSVESILTELKIKNISYLTYIDEDYPYLLKETASPPIVLYFKGDKTLLHSPCLGVVGTRMASSYGSQVIDYMIPELTSAGLTIVSGFQRGIDTLAHTQAIRSKGKTIAVLGTGLDVNYPPNNKKLYQEMLSDNNLIISEYPPGTLPFKGNFPRRNRIISGLSLGVLVIEAAKRSGSLITTSYAAEQGRDVFAVPGSVLSTYSEGPHYLIQQGAKLVQNAAQICEELGIISRPTGLVIKQLEISLSECQKKILTILDVYGKDIDSIIKELSSPAAEILSELTILELSGCVIKTENGIYSKTIP
ncbi:MAG: DNA-processing protein DprA [bacterium]|nr:DNA-processing protein DprA [bacterium]